MASRIQPRDPTPTTTAIACLVAVTAWILIGSVYVGNTAGWPQFVLSVFSAVTVCGLAISSLVYAAHQQFVVKHSLLADPGRRGDFNYRSTGQWAVVTGATDGIGKEYARQLAVNHGMDVVLVGRNPDKLRAVAGLIRKECGGLGRRVTTVVADFAEDPIAARGEWCGGRVAETTDDDCDCDCGGPLGRERGDDGKSHGDATLDDVGDRCFCGGGDDDRPSRTGRGRCTRWYPRLRAVVESRSSGGGVGVLINCAGVCYPHPEYFAGMSGRDGARQPDGFTAGFCDNADAAIRCNVTAAVHACRLVLPGMLARGRGLIVNVGSAAASMPPAAPLMTLYSATKKFLEKLSVDLDAECAYLTRDRRGDDSFGVRVQCARPAYVVTAMLRSANPDVRAVSGDDDGSDAEESGDDDGDRGWWAARRKRVEDGVQWWMVPSARRWVRSALRQGGRLYADGDGAGPANFTGYWPHSLLVWCGRLASALTPRRWFVNRVLIPGMLVYRAKGRSA